MLKAKLSNEDLFSKDITSLVPLRVSISMNIDWFLESARQENKNCDSLSEIESTQYKVLLLGCIRNMLSVASQSS